MTRVTLKRTGFKREPYQAPAPTDLSGVTVRPSTTALPEGREVAKTPPMRSERYKAWIRTQPCCARKLTPCEGGVEASHHPPKMHGTISMKTSDGNVIPLCFKHHQCDFGGSQTIGGQSVAQTQLFIREQIMLHRAKWEVIEMIGGVDSHIEEVDVEEEDFDAAMYAGLLRVQEGNAAMREALRQWSAMIERPFQYRPATVREMARELGDLFEMRWGSSLIKNIHRLKGDGDLPEGSLLLFVAASRPRQLLRLGVEWSD